MSASKYSSFTKTTTHKPTRGDNLDTFYDGLTSATGILFTIVGFFALLRKSILTNVSAAFDGDAEAQIHLYIVALTFLAGFRLVQSLLLAKRDYRDIESGLVDIIIFLAVVLFMSGAVINLAPMLGIADPMITVLIIYAVCCLVGTLNFARLYLFVVPQNPDNLDIHIEKPIQLLNTMVFAALTILLAAAVMIMKTRGPDAPELPIVFSCAYPLLILNILHSQQLTMAPKFLLNNAADATQSLVDDLKAALSSNTPDKEAEEILELVRSKAGGNYLPIETVRVSREDIDEVCDTLIHNFSYVYRFLFGVEDEAQAKAVLRKLMRFSSGFGQIGYLNFRFIVNSETKEKVGLFRMETAEEAWIYGIRDMIVLPIVAMICLRTFSIFSIMRRIHKISQTQKSPTRRELRIAYLAIFPKYQNKGYAHSFLHLLKNAFLKNYTDDLIVDKITLYARTKNKRALELFNKSAFLTAKPAVSDVLSKSDNSVGDLVFMSCGRP